MGEFFQPTLDQIDQGVVHEVNAKEAEARIGLWQSKLLRLLTASSIFLGSLVASEESMSSEALAETITYSDLGYPWVTAPCQFGDAGGAKCANPNNPKGDLYDWYVDEDGDGQFGSSSNRTGCGSSGASDECFRAGYEYRNCTDYVQWKESTIGVNVPAGWGNGGQWYDHAPNNMKSDSPAAGDAAIKPVSSSDAFGHVAYVESVNDDGTITVSEYNHDAAGHGDTRTGTVSEMGLTKFVDFGVHPHTSSTSPRTSGPTFTPATVQRPSGETDIAVVGPANSLDFYYNPAGTTSWGKTSIPNAAYSTPAMVQRPNGETDIAVQGPDNSLDFYFNLPGSVMWGMRHVAAPGYALSAPAMIQRSLGETDIAVLGPNNSLDYYFNTQGTPNWGISHVAVQGYAYGPPAMALRPTGEVDIAVQGPANSLDFYYNQQGSPFWAVSHVAVRGYAFSAPAMVQRPSTGETDVAVQGPNNQLDLYINDQGSPLWGHIPAAGPGTTFAAPNPPAVRQRPSGETGIAVKGPGDQASLYYNFQGSPHWSNSLAAAPGYAIRQPVMVQRPNGETDLVIVGPNNRLDFYMNQQGAPYWGNIPIAGSGSGS